MKTTEHSSRDDLEQHIKIAVLDTQNLLGTLNDLWEMIRQANEWQATAHIPPPS